MSRSSRSNALLLAALGIGAVFALRRSSPAIDWGVGDGWGDVESAPDDPYDWGPIDWGVGDGWDDPAFPMPDYPLFPIPDAIYWEDPMRTTSSKMRALLYMIRRSEHSAADVAADLDWTTFYGGSRFSSLADHPVLTGEKRGVPLPPEYCRAAGFSPGCVSTAAGAFQFIVPTWNRLRALSPRLPDFSPDSQTAAAIRLIKEKGADRLVEAGDLEGAIYRLSGVWASLPHSRSNQPHRTLDEVVAFYDEGLTLG